MPRPLFAPACRVLLLLAAVALASAHTTARAEEYYFGLIFGSQDHPKHLRNTHTWATFVRAVGQGPDLNQYQLYVHTISWYPATLEVKVFRPVPETGINLTLEQTLGIVLNNGESVTLWGPFLLSRRVYDRSLQVRQILESGRAEYRAISTQYNLLVADCIHAVAAVDPVFGRDHYPLIRIGKPASRFIARQVVTRSLYDQWQYDNSWFIPRLGLDRYPIEVVPPRALPKQGCTFCLLPP